MTWNELINLLSTMPEQQKSCDVIVSIGDDKKLLANLIFMVSWDENDKHPYLLIDEFDEIS